MNTKQKKTAIILPDSEMDNGHDRELDCNDTDSEAKNIYQSVNGILLISSFFLSTIIKVKTYEETFTIVGRCLIIYRQRLKWLN